MKKYFYCFLLLFLPLLLNAHSDEKTVKTEEFSVPKKIFTSKDDFIVKIIEMDNWSFNEEIIELKRNVKYRLIFITMEGHHGVVFPDLKMESENITLGESVIFDFEFNDTGEFDYYCNILCGSGHSQMNGKIIVR